MGFMTLGSSVGSYVKADQSDEARGPMCNMHTGVTFYASLSVRQAVAIRLQAPTAAWIDSQSLNGFRCNTECWGAYAESL
ncbi:hypothetical protein H4Q26_001361 [Puccinia striiformis f. sp. tritici PST-130]|uniref:Uncharacterized protein n=1 Tax=Puccinia striiformis f. sp. tritici PST-78 TaxID=1165861 RepID=A0A0L0UVX3_9BASI|nr:hypothetical protein H4Q26_001361 [Puccinia striiformis f. sp. tritici PST-130]KNE91170.1 hypothetical protein PSTG_15426 [Puccinia striiformis f. sp. tritici PST-78]